MLGDLQVYALVSLFGLVLYWSVPATQGRLRQGVLVVVSALAVFLYSPGGFLACVYLTAVPMLFAPLFRKGRSLVLFWLAILLVLLPLVGMRLLTDQPFILSFGVAFATTKAIALVVTAYGGRVALRWLDAALLIFFFPLFTVGPVERLNTFAPEKLQTRLASSDLGLGLVRIAIGLFTVMFVCNTVLGPIRDGWFGRDEARIAALGMAEAWGLLVSSFLFTYLNFVGFSEVAIGLSRMFGIRATENFNRPLLVTNVADFWKNYHISMGNWINQFLFFPIAVSIKRDWGPYAATMIAFVLFGMWHEFSVNYLLWGLGNGFGVVLVQILQRRKTLPLARGTPVVRRIIAPICGALALSWVAFLQTVANLPSVGAAGVFALRLLGV